MAAAGPVPAPEDGESYRLFGDDQGIKFVSQPGGNFAFTIDITMAETNLCVEHEEAFQAHSGDSLLQGFVLPESHFHDVKVIFEVILITYIFYMTVQVIQPGEL